MVDSENQTIAEIASDNGEHIIRRTMAGGGVGGGEE